MVLTTEDVPLRGGDGDARRNGGTWNDVNSAVDAGNHFQNDGAHLRKAKAAEAGVDVELAVPLTTVDEPTTPAAANENKRIQWSSPTEFLLTCIGYSVGLGNVWRFPYLCYKNGGGAFLIPYALMILLIGIPLLFMEYGFGQYFGIGSLSIFKQVCPLFQGVGLGYSILNSLIGIYYNVIIALALYYLFGSLTASLPWASCDNSWNTDTCGDPVWFNMSGVNSTNYSNNTLLNATQVSLIYNSSKTVGNSSNISLHRTSPSDEFFRLGVMGEQADTGIGNIGHVRWQLCLCLLLAWILVALFVCKGIKSSGKVAYFTATFPYVMLTVLVVRGATLEGSIDGILYFIVPDWKKLASPDVWFQAATQLFYATNLAWGGMITMASYNVFHHNCYRDAIVINFVSFGTSLYAGIAVFSIIGFMAHEQHVPIEKVINSGPGLAFVAYPRALSMMPLAPIWSALFFFMLFLLGIGSQMVGVETIMTGIMDTWQSLVLHWQYRVLAVIGVCTIGFVLGIPCTTQGGMYVLQLMDYYSAGFCVLVIAIIECLVINWIYGVEKMATHVEAMTGYRVHKIWKICWKIISPTLIILILIFSFVRYKPVEYGGSPYPAWAEVIGWMMTLASNIPIFIVGVIVLFRAPGSTLRQKLATTTMPRVEVEPQRAEDGLQFDKTTELGQETENGVDGLSTVVLATEEKGGGISLRTMTQLANADAGNSL